MAFWQRRMRMRMRMRLRIPEEWERQQIKVLPLSQKERHLLSRKKTLVFLHFMYWMQTTLAGP